MENHFEVKILMGQDEFVVYCWGDRFWNKVFGNYYALFAVRALYRTSCNLANQMLRMRKAALDELTPDNCKATDYQ